MILGLGTDLLELERMQQALRRTPKLSARILTGTEQIAFAQAKDAPRYLAKRFAAKEAIAKALGSGIGRGVSWQHIEINKDQHGRPVVELSGGAKQWAKTLGIQQVHLSYSDERAYILAFAVAEGVMTEVNV
ncbi:holo-ACP synthase [Pontibacter sp. JAM-7]|uniref:holo-ACP synthase n=1 Tax=Pontibacter sp. JAM-7 TaxID=3366581 RepID=UPI003AF60398